jgi:spore coat polysaccharide biosynthesis protein SpsF (cytidylyltransferase family)
MVLMMIMMKIKIGVMIKMKDQNIKYVIKDLAKNLLIDEIILNLTQEEKDYALEQYFWNKDLKDLQELLRYKLKKVKK